MLLFPSPSLAVTQSREMHRNCNCFRNHYEQLASPKYQLIIVACYMAHWHAIFM